MTRRPSRSHREGPRVRVATLDVRGQDVLLPFGLVGFAATLAILLTYLA